MKSGNLKIGNDKEKILRFLIRRISIEKIKNKKKRKNYSRTHLRTSSHVLCLNQLISQIFLYATFLWV